MNLGEFQKKVAEGGTVPLSASEWEELESNYQVVERHNTQLAGDLLIIQFGEAFAAVESPSRDARVIRFLGDRSKVDAFVRKRMEEYERMWDGCGVKVEYYG